jgi:ribosome-associated heat shock protein Hsp15
MENTTTPDQLELLELHKLNKTINRARGTGRPTKKERREIDSFFDDDYFLEEND